MSKILTKRSICAFFVIALLAGSIYILLQPSCFAAGEEEVKQEKAPVTMAEAVKAIAAALAVGLAALGTGTAQARIGAGGTGLIAERPESAGTVIVLVAIPETMIILGFVIGAIIIFT